MAKSRLTQEAETDIAGIAAWSRAQFGDGARRRYVALIAAAILDVASNPDRVGHSPRPELGDEIRTWHIRLSRRRSTTGTVRQPRHVLVHRREGDVVTILRVLHEAMDLPLHLDSTPDSEA